VATEDRNIPSYYDFDAELRKSHVYTMLAAGVSVHSAELVILILYSVRPLTGTGCTDNMIETLYFCTAAWYCVPR
jgi:hypothetical protein